MTMLLKKRTFLFVTMPLYAWAIAMVTVSSMPGKSLPEIGLWQWDKLAHIFEFAIFAILLYRYLVERFAAAESGAWIVCIIISCAYGILDELHQLAIPQRFCTWQDLVADSVGAVIGILSIRAYYGRRARRQ